MHEPIAPIASLEGLPSDDLGLDDVPDADEGDLEDMLGATSTIGRAVASIKLRLGLDDEAAFTHLVQLAEQCNVRLRDAAADIVPD